MDARRVGVWARRVQVALSLAACASPAAAQMRELQASVQLLSELRELTSTGADRVRADSRWVHAVEREIDNAFEAINRLSEISCTDGRAVVYVGNDDPDTAGTLPSTVTLHVIGPVGDGSFTFVSGTALSAVAAAINTLQQQIGADAMICAQNEHRLEIRSQVAWPMNHYVQVVQHGGEQALLYAQPSGGTAMRQWTDYPCSIGVPLCAKPAELYLSTGAWVSNGGADSLQITVQGTWGDGMLFTFASGVTQAAIIEAINAFQFNLRVTAEQSSINPGRIVIRSSLLGENASLQLHQNGGLGPMIFAEPEGGSGAFFMQAVGRSSLSGDTNCNWFVDTADLFQVIDAWGMCPWPPLTCPGDVTGDGVVNVDDLLRVIQFWGAAG